MKYYVQFLDKNLKGEIGEACGSDGVFILDGRNSLSTMLDDAYERMARFDKLHNYVGFTIRRGDLKHSARVATRLKQGV